VSRRSRAGTPKPDPLRRGVRPRGGAALAPARSRAAHQSRLPHFRGWFRFCGCLLGLEYRKSTAER